MISHVNSCGDCNNSISVLHRFQNTITFAVYVVYL